MIEGSCLCDKVKFTLDVDPKAASAEVRITKPLYILQPLIHNVDKTMPLSAMSQNHGLLCVSQPPGACHRLQIDQWQSQNHHDCT